MRYKPFHNQLAKPGFPVFMRLMLTRLLNELACEVLQFSPDSPFARFEQIRIQDGSSFALKSALAPTFPGRFTTVSNGMDSSSPHLFGVDAPEWEVQTNHSGNEEKSEMKITRVGVDLAKSVFHIHAVDRRERPQWQTKLKRCDWVDALCERLAPGAEVGMEACASAHHWGRELQGRGIRVKLIAAQFVKPYVKSNKNDSVDAEAICEAMSRPGMRFVSLKTIAQQDIQAMHRIRSELISQRTAKVNQIRGLVGEYGIVAPTGINQLRRALPVWLEDAENGLSGRFRGLLCGLREDLQHLDERVAELDSDIAKSVTDDPLARRLLALRGVGPLTASALTGALADGASFRRGRDFAASIGLTPRQHSTGGRDRLLGISKRGDPYLRKLLVHGARAVLRHAEARDDALSQWVNAMSSRKHPNVVTVALANKTARVAWAIAARGTTYDPELIAASTAA
jgi:transposase